MFTVSELANQSGTTPHAVRYYTRMGLLRPQRNPNNGYRLYPQHEVSWLRFVHQAKRLGYTLAEIREIMHDSERGRSPCPRVRAILIRRIGDNHREIEERKALQARMQQALQQWAQMPDGVPDGHSVCHLIESFAEKHTSGLGGGH